jgi:ribosomal protein L11 methylase PrmA
MAPGLALDRLPRPQAGLFRVLDAMMGSGTIPVLAAMRQHEAVGFDLDPLAVLIAQAWGRPLIVSMFMRAAREVAHSARDLSQDPTMNTADRFRTVARLV